MHKKFFNHCTIELNISPNGPILIKSGREGADPTKPDMEFVETYYQGKPTIYLPGSSLKGAIRAHAERIVRTVGGDASANNSNGVWASDPLDNEDSEYLKKLKKVSSSEIYKLSSFTDQLFGNVCLASHLRIEDAYPISEIKTEERNGVAIDRVFGSVAVGPFNYQVCTQGEFKTKIHIKNFTLAQLGLIGLVLRDLNDGWFGIGFAKSRGLGTVSVNYEKALIQYPTCLIDNGRLKLVGTSKDWAVNELLGVGAFLSSNECQIYGFSDDEKQETDLEATVMEFGLGVQMEWSGDKVKDLFRQCVTAWCNKIGAIVT